MIKKMIKSDLFERIIKTFFEGVVAYLITIGGVDLTNTHLLKGILVGAVASGISAVLNLAQTYLKKSKEVK